MRAVALLACLAFTVADVGARADPPPEPEKLERPATPRRRAVQVLGLTSLVLVLGGVGSLGASLSSYQTVRDGCGTTNSCTRDELSAGKIEQGVGWGLVSAGVILGLTTMILAVIDSRAARRNLALLPSLSGFAIAGW